MRESPTHGHRQDATLGGVLGLLFGAWNTIAAQITPLADDTPAALLTFYGPMFTAWAIAGFLAVRRTGRLADGPRTGALVGFVTFLVLTAIVIARVNLFLDVTTQRPDWQNLMARYQTSGFGSLRRFANYVYITGAPFKLFVATAIGAVVGFAGGCVGLTSAGTRPGSAVDDVAP